MRAIPFILIRRGDEAVGRDVPRAPSEGVQRRGAYDAASGGLVALTAVFLACLAFLASGLAARAQSVARTAPATALLSVSFFLTNTVAPASGTFVYAVEESVPTNWTVANVNLGGRFDAVGRKIKWGPYFDDQPRQLSARLTPDAGSVGLDFAWNGTASFDGAPGSFSGSSRIQVLGAGRANSVTRTFPAAYQWDVPFAVSLAVDVAPNTRVQAVEERVPVGWGVAAPSHGGSFDAVTRTVRWGPFFDAVTRTLTYQVTPVPTSEVTPTFSGGGAFDGSFVAAGGASVPTPAGSRVTRGLPVSYLPESPVPVSLGVLPAPGTGNWAIEESVPEGWVASTISGGGAFDAVRRRIRWGPFFSDLPQTLTYVLTSPAGARSLVQMTGQGAFDGVVLSTTGDASLNPSPSTVTRLLPSSFTPGVGFVLTLQTAPADVVSAQAFEQLVPEGWTIGPMSDSGSWDARLRRVKWGPFLDNAARTLTVQLNPPLSARGAASLSGTASFDGAQQEIGGPSALSPASSFVASSGTVLLPGESRRSGSNLTVVVQIRPAAGAGVHAVELSLPAPLTPVAISDSGGHDAVRGRIKWGPFFDVAARDLTVTLAVPASTEGLRTFAGVLSVDGADLALGNPASIRLIPNTAPNAAADRFLRQSGGGLSIPIARLLANDSDANQDSLELIGFQASTADGGTVVREGNQLRYTPRSGSGAGDSFTYTISDPYGGTASGTVTVDVDPATAALNLLGLTVLPGGEVSLRFQGVPLRTYLIQYSASLLNPAWQTLGSRTADGVGGMVFVDATAAGAAARFYRTATP